jgi:hypothetical protein
MKRLALGLVVVLMTGTMAWADDFNRLAIVNGEEVGPPPASRAFTYYGDPGEDIEQRLKAIEQKLDRILRELEGMKGRRQAASYFDFAVGAFY